ncbi:MAG: amino acid ABC transporter ATP-binding protein [Proteobacteria bacterium]|nr:amino acid ABC transporter ATP-binding protein [Pseudomonadota bacterium]
MLSIKGLIKVIAERKILDGINLEVPQGQVVAIIGPSGGGKSTLLRCINGLERYEDGSVTLGNLQAKDVGMVFQHFNLFPHMTLFENLIYAPIKVQRISRDKAIADAVQMLEKVGLAECAHIRPARLSGGQRQRGAIARTLCTNPKLLLIDEPTSALDPENVKEVLGTIRSFAHTGLTMLIVTHEMGFAKEVADRIIFMEDGRVVADGSADTFFSSQGNPRVRQFLEKVL